MCEPCNAKNADVERGSEREFASLSEIKEAEEPLSSNALASTVDLSGASTYTRQVMSKVLDVTPDAMLDDIETTCCLSGGLSTFSCSMCSSV